VIRQPDFTGPRIKVERAKEHFANLKRLNAELRQSEPYQVVTENDPETGDLVFKAKVSRQPPPYWGTIVGDIIHNLRSSLDLLVCELVRAQGMQVKPNTGFPVFKDATAFTNAFKSGTPGQIKGAPQAAVDLIKKAKPYNGGNEALWRLHRLDIADKHKLLIPVGMAYQSVILDMARSFDDLDVPSSLRSGLQDLSAPISIPVADRQYPLKDGAILFKVAGGSSSKVYENTQFAFEVAFGEGEVVEGEPVFPTLSQLGQFVEGFVELFPPLFSQEPPPDVPPSEG
jgi:hypothetical protein